MEKPCVFPFKYNWVEHHNCTTHGNGNGILWCATSVAADGHYEGWGECDLTKCLIDEGNSDILS